MTGPVDFGDLGAEAYPGRLAVRWGAELVEPPNVRVIRGLARDRLVQLSGLAPPHYGIPTRSVQYFCVQEMTDSELLARYGIVTGADKRRLALVKDGRGVLHLLERVALKPIIRRPAVLDNTILVSLEAADPWRLFSLQMDMSEIRERRLQHILEYLDYGTRANFRGGPRRRGGVVAERANVSVRARWWSVTTMPEGAGRIAWPIGRGDVHYVPELPEGVVIPNNFMYSTPPPELQHSRLIAAVANLSWTHVMAEVYGRRSAGDGVLLMYLRELNALPLPDPRLMTQAEADEFLLLYEAIATRPVQPVTQELQRPERQAFDRFGMSFLVGPERAADAADAVARALRDLTAERIAKAATGREQQQRARRRQDFDPEPIAARVLQLAGRPPDLRVLLGDLDPEVIDNVTFEVPPHERAETITVGASLLDHDQLMVNGAVVVATPTPAHALALRSAMTTDPEMAGPFTLPRREDAANEAVASWEARFATWGAEVRERTGTMLPGVARARRRGTVLRSIERQAGILPRSLQ